MTLFSHKKPLNLVFVRLSNFEFYFGRNAELVDRQDFVETEIVFNLIFPKVYFNPYWPNVLFLVTLKCSINGFDYRRQNTLRHNQSISHVLVCDRISSAVRSYLFSQKCNQFVVGVSQCSPVFAQRICRATNCLPVRPTRSPKPS